MRHSAALLAALVATLAASLTAMSAASAVPSAPGGSAGLLTRIYSTRGILLTEIERSDEAGGEWVYPPGGTLECWISTSVRGWWAGVTHNTDGGSVPAGRNRWNVWAGRTFRGFAIRRSARRWDIFSRKARLVAYTRGPDGGAAATGYLVLGICE